MARPLMEAFVRLRADSEGLRADAEALTAAATENLSADVNLELDDDRANRKIAEMKARLRTLGAQVITARANLDVDDKAGQAKLAAFQLRLANLDKRVAEPKIKLEGIARAETQLLALDAAISRTGKSTGGMLSNFKLAERGFGTLTTAAVAFGPAAVVAIGAAATATFGLAAATGAAGAAMGVFGVTAATQFKGMTEAAKKLAPMQAAVMNAKDSAAKADALAKLTAAQRAYNAQFGPAATGWANLQGAWERWKASTSGPTLTILGQGMNVLAAALPQLRPLFDLGAKAAARFLGVVSNFVSTGGLGRAVAMLTALGRTVLPYFETAMRNLGVTVANTAPLIAQFAEGSMRAFARLTGAMAAWSGRSGTATGFTRFMEFVNTNGPVLMATLGAIAVAAVNIAKGIAPLAPITMTVAAAFAQLIAAIPPQVITALATGFIAYSVAARAAGIAQLFVNSAMRANIIGMIITAVVLLAGWLIHLYKTNETFRNIVNAAWRAVWDVIRAVFNWVRTNWPLLLGILTGPVGIATLAIIKNWKTIRDAAAAAVQAIRNSFAWLVDRILGVFGAIIHGAAAAFGWVPGLGGKLRGAAAAFDRFRDSVNNSLRGVQSRTLSFQMRFGTATGQQKVWLGATGGLIPGQGTGDTVPAMLTPGEAVVPKHLVPAVAPLLSAHKVPGFATGGLVGNTAVHSLAARLPQAALPGFASGGLVIQPKVPPESTIRSAISAAVLEEVTSHISSFLSLLGGGPMIAYARQFLGVPYVWGGTTPAGWDCSGFTSWVYHHFGYPAPRTSQMQQLWARPSGDTPGALVFFYGYGGTASHVGLSMGDGRMINAYGTDYGTIISPSRMAGFSGFGVPPNGFDSGGWLPPGLSVAYNGTGRPERVLPPGEGGTAIVLENHGVIGSQMELENWLARAVDDLRRKGRI